MVERNLAKVDVVGSNPIGRSKSIDAPPGSAWRGVVLPVAMQELSAMAQTQSKGSKRPAYVVKDSPIHGKGLFAARAIGGDELIGVFEARRTRKDGTYVLWLIDDDGKETGWRGINDLRFVNHSKQANAEFYDRELWSLRAIKKNDEILIDYGWDE